MPRHSEAATGFCSNDCRAGASPAGRWQPGRFPYNEKPLAAVCHRRPLLHRGGVRRRYLPKTFFMSPTFFCTLPATFSSVPRSLKLGLPIAFPLSSLTLPLASRRVPLILSFVLDLIHLIRCGQRV